MAILRWLQFLRILLVGFLFLVLVATLLFRLFMLREKERCIVTRMNETISVYGGLDFSLIVYTLVLVVLFCTLAFVDTFKIPPTILVYFAALYFGMTYLTNGFILHFVRMVDPDCVQESYRTGLAVVYGLSVSIHSILLIGLFTSCWYCGNGSDRLGGSRRYSASTQTTL